MCQTGKGENYRGYHQMAFQAYCSSWEGSPYADWYKKSVSPIWNRFRGLPDNLCRNPEGSGDDKNGAWCYTKGDFSEWAHCDIRRCTVCDTGNYINQTRLISIVSKFVSILVVVIVVIVFVQKS